jgi:hypothetical protein
MLVIDEIHAMLQGTFREQRTFLNALRFLANDLRIPLICLGTNEAKQALMPTSSLQIDSRPFTCLRGLTMRRSHNC